MKTVTHHTLLLALIVSCLFKDAIQQTGEEEGGRRRGDDGMRPGVNMRAIFYKYVSIPAFFSPRGPRFGLPFDNLSSIVSAEDEVNDDEQSDEWEMWSGEPAFTVYFQGGAVQEPDYIDENRPTFYKHTQVPVFLRGDDDYGYPNMRTILLYALDILPMDDDSEKPKEWTEWDGSPDVDIFWESEGGIGMMRNREGNDGGERNDDGSDDKYRGATEGRRERDGRLSGGGLSLSLDLNIRRNGRGLVMNGGNRVDRSKKGSSSLENPQLFGAMDSQQEGHKRGEKDHEGLDGRRSDGPGDRPTGDGGDEPRGGRKDDGQDDHFDQNGDTGAGRRKGGMRGQFSEGGRRDGFNSNMDQGRGGVNVNVNLNFMRGDMAFGTDNQDGGASGGKKQGDFPSGREESIYNVGYGRDEPGMMGNDETNHDVPNKINSFERLSKWFRAQGGDVDESKKEDSVVTSPSPTSPLDLSAICVDECTEDVPMGLYRTCDACDTSIRCFGTSASGSRRTCSSGLQINEDTIQCDVPDNVNCMTLTNIEDILEEAEENRKKAAEKEEEEKEEDVFRCIESCWMEKDGAYPVCGSCSEFVYCWMGMSWPRRCLPGQYFSPVFRQCMHELEVDCKVERSRRNKED